jgi:hypothetical protein
MAKTIDQLIINSPYDEPKEHWSYNPLIAVKIVDDRGIESLKVIPVGNTDSGK